MNFELAQRSTDTVGIVIAYSSDGQIGLSWGGVILLFVIAIIS